VAVPVLLPALPRTLVSLVLAWACVAGLLVLGPAPAATAGTGSPVVSADSRLCLDVRAHRRTPGAAVNVWDCHGQDNQQWSRDGQGRLRTLGDTLCLAPSSAAPGAAAVTAVCSDDTEQRWTHSDQQTLVNVGTGLCLDVEGARRVRGTPVILHGCHGDANQRWTAPGPSAAVDVDPPASPVLLGATALGCRSVLLSWTAASDDVAVSAYDVFHDGQLVRSVAGSTLSVEVPAVPSVPWGWYVNARDAAGNVSQASATSTVRPPACSLDTEAPTSPAQVRAVVTGTAVTVTWSPSTDDVGVSAYDVLRDGVRTGTVTVVGAGTSTSYTDSALAAATTYEYTVVARDAQDNASRPSASARVTTGPACASPVCAVREVVEDSDVPWGLVVLPDGHVLYSRRDAHDVISFDPVTGVTRRIGSVPGVASTDGEGGLMGIAVGPGFASDRWLYVMHTTPTDARIVRIRYDGGALDPASTQVLVRGILRNKYHNGGRLRFGPDGMLYAATGDAQQGDFAQALTGVGALNGKILRMTPLGQVPGDNPFPGSLVWSYGHRNPQGLAFDSQGRLWEQEFGNSLMDETNLVVKGGNYGWPLCEGTVSVSGGGCGRAGLVAPKRTYAPATASCSGLAAVGDQLWVACARGARLYRHQIEGDALTGSQELLVGAYGRLRTVEPAADGGLWLTTTNHGDKDSVPHNSAEKVLHLDLARTRPAG
jgi:glucose/arabinose dehydrogenase